MKEQFSQEYNGWVELSYTHRPENKSHLSSPFDAFEAIGGGGGGGGGSGIAIISSCLSTFDRLRATGGGRIGVVISSCLSTLDTFSTIDGEEGEGVGVSSCRRWALFKKREMAKMVRKRVMRELKQFLSPNGP